jgi:two-component system, NarL family, response regulator NreC
MPAHLQLAPDMPDADPAPKRPIRVVLADDHTLMRRGLRRLLDDQKDVEVIAEVAALTAVAEHVHRSRPHVLVLDLGMANGSGVDVIGRLRYQVPGTEIVVLTMHDSPEFALKALDAGAIGFVLKEYADAELPVAVLAAARGDEFLSPRVGPRLESLRRSMADDTLTVRETDVLRLATRAELAQCALRRGLLGG